jgi:glycerophosphoryl diester phosphodiesterase
MKPPAILAHRANLAGPDRPHENSLAACARALAEDFGLEIDLRREAGGAFYIAHDPQPRTAANDFPQYAALFMQWPDLVVATNVKELGYEQALIDLHASGQLGRAAFYFDFELLELAQPGAAQRRLRSLPGGAAVPLASRLSDRGESLDQCLGIPAEFVWADEFDGPFLQREHVAAIHAAGRRFYAVSPELHGFGDEARLQRWREFREWGIDGLCTDYALEARRFFGA